MLRQIENIDASILGDSIASAGSENSEEIQVKTHESNIHWTAYHAASTEPDFTLRMHVPKDQVDAGHVLELHETALASDVKTRDEFEMRTGRHTTRIIGSVVTAAEVSTPKSRENDQRFGHAGGLIVTLV